MTGRVLDVSRRHVSLLASSGSVVNGTIGSKAIDIVTGDVATYETRDGKVFVTDVVPSRRTLSRSYRGVVKRMGANIDLLCVITAVGATLNPTVIDRMLIAARIEDIPTTLIVNKADLGMGEVDEILDVYRELGIKVLECSAKFGQSFDAVEHAIQGDDVAVVALCGVSGVGKSTILNRLIPGALAKTGEISERTGQGRQTTSQPRGFLYEGTNGLKRVIIDFPGVQFLSLIHI